MVMDLWKPSETVLVDLTEMSREIDALLQQLRSLREKIVSCGHVVSSFCELANGHSLKQLAEAARLESIQTTELNVRSQRDAAAIKALTVVALIYLPTTVVLVSCHCTGDPSNKLTVTKNFFSTCFTNIEQGNVVLFGRWWLFIIVGVPLTILTIAGWQLWLHLHENADSQKRQHFKTEQSERLEDVEKG